MKKQRKFLVSLLITAFLIPLFPAMWEKAEAASDFNCGGVVGTVESGPWLAEQYDIGIDKGDLVISTEVSSGSKLRFGYHTKALCFRKDATCCTPHVDSEYMGAMLMYSELVLGKTESILEIFDMMGDLVKFVEMAMRTFKKKYRNMSFDFTGTPLFNMKSIVSNSFCMRLQRGFDRHAYRRLCFC